MIEFADVPASVIALVRFSLNHFSLSSFPVWEIMIKSTILIALAALACLFLYQQSAAMRHRIWVFGLTATLVVPIISLFMPQFTLHVLPSTMQTSGLAKTQDLKPASPTQSVESFRTESTGGISTSGTTLQAEQETNSSTAIAVTTPKTVQRSAEFSLASTDKPGIEQILLYIWLTGTVLSSTLFLISLSMQSFRLGRLRRIDDADWVDSVTTAARSLGLQRSIVTLESDERCVPAVVGVFSPRLIIPSDWRTWSLAQRQCILLHELAHVKRCDVSTQLSGRLALLVYWFHPLVWYAVRQLRIERELATDDCVLLAGQRASEYAEQLLRTLQCYRPARIATGATMAHSARLDQRVLAILDAQRRRGPVGTRFAISMTCIVSVICFVLGGLTFSTPVVLADQQSGSKSALEAKNAKPVWREQYRALYPSTFPVSVEFSSDGKKLLTGDTGGIVTSLIFTEDEPQWEWKSKAEGSYAAVAYSPDQKQIYATTRDGVRILDAAQGKEESRIEEKDSNPTAIGVFPLKTIAKNIISTQIVFGNPHNYFVKSWLKNTKTGDSGSAGTIKTDNVAKGAETAEVTAVPLAVDPKGRSAIMTGPIDAQGENILWAYVCGNHDKDSPGNRVLAGHSAIVVSAAWAKKKNIAVTGDASGRVIVWDTDTMKETGRLELGARVAALAISDDGTRTAAYVLGERGEVFVWETAKPIKSMNPIHTESDDFREATASASLSFSPDGKQLAGCALDKRWLSRSEKLSGKAYVWKLSVAPKAQLPPKLQYTKTFPQDSSLNFIIHHNSIFKKWTKDRVIYMLNITDGRVLSGMKMGKLNIGGMKLSPDQNWLAMEEYVQNPPGSVLPLATEFDVSVRNMKTLKRLASIPSCSQLLDVSTEGKAIAVVRKNQIELWDVANSKLLMAAPFKTTRIDAVRFSPDGNLLAISDNHQLVLWRWKEKTHTQIDLGRCVGSLAFTPDGKLLAEGPKPGKNIQVRDVETKKVVQTLTNGTEQSMSVPQLAYTQNGRVLIACDNIKVAKGEAVPHRINLWDTSNGSLAHQISIPAGLPQTLEVSSNGRYLITTLQDSDDMKLSVWRLDGKYRVPDPGPILEAVPASR